MRRNDWLIGQLPMGMLDDGFFVRFASLFQELATSLLDGVDNIPNAVDVTVAPAPLVRWLGSWIGVANIDSSLPVELQRRIVRESGQILSWRGTRRGLVQFLELATGGPVEVEDSGGIFVAGEAGHRAPYVRMRVESTGWIREDDFVAVVVDELPANVTYELYVQDRRLWPPPSPFEAIEEFAEGDGSARLGVPAGVRVARAGEGSATVGIDPAVAGSGPTVADEAHDLGAAADGPAVSGDVPPFSGEWTPPPEDSDGGAI